jgi:hypothetical protein
VSSKALLQAGPFSFGAWEVFQSWLSSDAKMAVNVAFLQQQKWHNILKLKGNIRKLSAQKLTTCHDSGLSGFAQPSIVNTSLTTGGTGGLN